MDMHEAGRLVSLNALSYRTTAERLDFPNLAVLSLPSASAN